MNKKIITIISLMLACMLVFSGCSNPQTVESEEGSYSNVDVSEPIESEATASSEAEPELDVDLYFENGTIYTADENDRIVEALAIKDDKIIFVGSAVDGASYKEAAKEVTDLDGKLLLPGFIDNHIHSDAPQGFDFDLTDIYDEEKIRQTVMDYIEKHPDLEFFTGWGLETAAFKGKEEELGPHKKFWDDICPDKPVLTYGSDGHASFLNTKALELMKITVDSKSPKGGTIPKDENGELWGVLQDSAMTLAKDYPVNEERSLKALKEYMTMLNSYGYTSMSSPSANGYLLMPVHRYKSLDDSDELSMRVYAMPIITEWDMENDLEILKNYTEEIDGNFLKIHAAKFFLDGVVETETALLVEPYTSNPSTIGAPGWERPQLDKAVEGVWELGLPVHFHAIGDGAVRMGLDSIEETRATLDATQMRDVITHLELVNEDDYSRFAELGVIAVANPAFQYKDEETWKSKTFAKLGERAEKIYPMKSLLDNGATLAFASDYPAVSSPSIFNAIQIGITRNLVGESTQSKKSITDINDPEFLLWPEERVSLTDMLRGYTINAAYSLYEEDRTGSLEEGKLADMIILDQNLFEIDPINIHKTKVVKTYVNGEEVFSIN